MDDDDKEESSNKTKERAEDQKVMWDKLRTFQHKLQSGQAPTQYDTLVKYHIDAQTFAHGSPAFFPWHRGYLRHLELALQAVDPSCCLPYWNWAIDSQSPENSPLFSPQAFGNQNNGCVQYAFGQFNAYYPSPHCVTRQYNGGDTLGAFYSVEAVNRVITSTSDYDTFRTTVESMLHPTPHNNIGGDMSQMHSPNDVIFFLHHGYIDFMWSQWQRRNGLSYAGDRSTQLRGLPYTVDQVMDHTKLCYSYDDLSDQDLAVDTLPPSLVQRPSGDNRPEYVTVIPIPTDENTRYSARDRSLLNILRYPDQIPDAWFQMNSIDIGRARGYEDDYRNIHRRLNEIKGYISPCCLWKRASLCQGYVGKTKQFCCDVPGFGRMQIGYHNNDPRQCLSDVQARATYTNGDVQLPPDSYRAQVQSIVGASAFDGAGSMKPVVNMDMFGGSSQLESKAVMKGVTLAAALAAVMSLNN